MVKKNLKPGFSLFEACVVMLIVGIFVALCANAYSKRHITYQESDGHGRYECYKNAAGTLMQRYVENNNPRNVTGTTCVFRPPRYAKYLLLNAIGGGSAGDGQADNFQCLCRDRASWAAATVPHRSGAEEIAGAEGGIGAADCCTGPGGERPETGAPANCFLHPGAASGAASRRPGEESQAEASRRNKVYIVVSLSLKRRKRDRCVSSRGSRSGGIRPPGPASDGTSSPNS